MISEARFLLRDKFADRLGGKMWRAYGPCFAARLDLGPETVCLDADITGCKLSFAACITQRDAGNLIDRHRLIGIGGLASGKAAP